MYFLFLHLFGGRLVQAEEDSEHEGHTSGLKKQAHHTLSITLKESALFLQSGCACALINGLCVCVCCGSQLSGLRDQVRRRQAEEQPQYLQDSLRRERSVAPRTRTKHTLLLTHARACTVGKALPSRSVLILEMRTGPDYESF